MHTAPRLRFATVVLAFVASASATAGGIQGYITTDRDARDIEPPAPGWTELGPDGETSVELEGGAINRFWVAFPNMELPERKTFTLEWSGTPDGPRPTLWVWDGFVSPGRKVGNDGYRRHSRDVPNQYAQSFFFTTCPNWELFEFHVIVRDDTVETFKFCGDSMCIATPRFPPWHPFHRFFGKFGVPGAMTVDPAVTEVWTFPRSAPVDPDLPQSFEAPPHTGEWTAELVPADPEGNVRPLGGVRWTTEGPGLSIEDPFDATITTLGTADELYDLYLFDAGRDAYVQMLTGPDPWADSFDEYPVGPLAGLGGWEPWNGDGSAAGFEVTDEVSQSAPHALAIDGTDDAVQQHAGYVDGQWKLTASIFVPSAMDDQQALILLNTYPAALTQDWSLQLGIDGAEGLMRDLDTSASLPLVRDRWTPVEVLIDLDRDVQTVLYDGRRLVSKGWSNGVAEGGARTIQATDLFGAESAHRVFYDDVALSGTVIVGACLLSDGTCETVGADACAASEGEYLGDATECSSCRGDIDGSGGVGFSDVIAVLSAWGNEGGPEDLDDSGLVGFGDLIVLLSSWGPCATDYAWRFGTTVPAGLHPNDMHLFFTGTGGTISDVEVEPDGTAGSSHGNNVDVVWENDLDPGTEVTVTFKTLHPDVAFAGGKWTKDGEEIGDVQGIVEQE